MYNKHILHTFNEQINKLKSKGITFNNCTEKQAIEYLENHNYYFKLTSYRKNYDKEPTNGFYIKLDFFDLKEMAKIDMLFRHNIMALSLDVEHYTKLKLLNTISSKTDNKNNYVEDGYSIVKYFFQSANEVTKKKINDEIIRNQNTIYCKDLLTKLSDGIDIHHCDYYNSTQIEDYPVFQMNIPIWAFLELVTFGTVVSFVKFISEYYNDKELYNIHYLLKTCNKIRNAAAHSTCILNDLRKGCAYKTVDYKLVTKMKTKFKKTELKNRLSNERIGQFVTLLYLHNYIVTSSATMQRAKSSLMEFSKRMFENIDKIDNDLIKNNFKFIKKTIDFFY